MGENDEASTEEKEVKLIVQTKQEPEFTKSSMEILSELFGTFDAEPPLIIKKERDDASKKHKKSKKKHKHKDKKHHKKKDKKRKRKGSISSEPSEVDLAELMIKQERQSPEKKIKLEDGALTSIKNEKESAACAIDKNGKENTNDMKNTDSNTKIKNLKCKSRSDINIKKENKKRNREEGETSSNESTYEEVDVKKHKRKKKHKHSHSEKSKSSHSHNISSKEKNENHKEKSKSPSRKSSKHKDKSDNKNTDSGYRSDSHKNSSTSRHKENYKHKDDFYRTRSNSKERTYDDCKYKSKENPFYKENSTYRSRDHDRDDKYNRYKGYADSERNNDKRKNDIPKSQENDKYIDKKKLLEIARRNAIQMMKSGNLPAALTLGPQAQEKVLAAIKAGGKTIEELTDFCKSLSKKEEMGDLSSNSEGEIDGDSDTENKAFHHPFQLKDRPSSIIMNIKNSIPLPTKTAQERTAELRMQFPVSSGSQHRKTENEWVPVVPKKPEPPVQQPAIQTPPPIESPSSNQVSVVPPGPQVFPLPIEGNNIDIGSIVSQRLSAIRKLQENPLDIEALSEMHKSQRKMQTWAESKQQPGQFTGSTGASILSQAELASGYQAWAKKDQLQNAAPVSGGMGMHLLKKMGWNPGEGLGKEKTGALEPLLLEVKLDKKGLVANEEQKSKSQRVQKNSAKSMEGKHPVSLLGEFTAKKKLGAPEYTLCMESGPDHKKMFLFKVVINGLECTPEVASPNKKQAKADAAKLCLQKLGLIP